MKQSVLLILTSVLSLFFLSLHIADDIVRGFEPGGPSNLFTIPILVAWLYGTLVLTERRSGYVLILLGSILGAGIPFLHFRGVGGVAGGAIAKSGGALLWVWTLLALGACSTLSLLLSAQGLWRLRRAGRKEG